MERVRSEIKRLKGLLADYERLATPEERSWRHKKAEHPDEIVVVDRGNGLLVVCQEDVKATNKAIGHKLDAPVTENLIVTTNEEQGMPFTTMRVTLADLQRLDDKGVKYVVLDKNGNQAKAKSKKQGKGEKKVEPGQQVDYYSAFAEQYGLDAEEAKKETEGNKPSEASLSLSTPLTDEEVVAITDAMKANATVAPTVEINDANWKESVETPVGSVKMGENQKAKLFAKGREQQYGMLLETLSNPDVVLEEKDKEQNMFHERPSSYLFVKTFQKEDGSKYVHFESVTVSQEGMEVSISSHIIRENQLKNKLKSDRLLYKATALDAPANTSAEQPIVGGSLSSDGEYTNNSSNSQKNSVESGGVDGFVSDAMSIVIKDVISFPNEIRDEDTILKEQKGGKRGDKVSVKVGLLDNELYIQYKAGNLRGNRMYWATIKIPNATNYSAGQLISRLDYAGTTIDVARLAGDVIL